MMWPDTPKKPGVYIKYEGPVTPKINTAAALEFNEEHPIADLVNKLQDENRRLAYELACSKAREVVLALRPGPQIENVIFNDPATVVFWSDGDKTVVKCQPGDVFSKELGLAMAICKKVYGNRGNYNEVFKKWVAPNE